MWFNYHNTLHRPLVIFSFLMWTGITATAQSIGWSKLKADKLPTIKNIQKMELLNNELYITYEYPGSFGDQILQSYHINWDTQCMLFTKEYYKRKNGTYIFSTPTTFWDMQGNMFVTDRNSPYVYEVRKDTLVRNGDAILSSRSNCPYQLILEIKHPYMQSKGNYIFVGRQAKNGFQAVFRSINQNGKQHVEELHRLIFDKRYPAWIVNHGMFAYSPTKQKGVFAYMMFPAVEFLDFNHGTSILFKKGANTFNPRTMREGDIWESNPIHFKSLTTNELYVYCLYWGKAPQQTQPKRKHPALNAEIVMLNWKGTVYKVLKTTRNITEIAVSEDGKYLIGFNGRDFFMATL